MTSSIYWIDDNLLPGAIGIMARPRAADWLEDEIQSWQYAGVALTVSLLEREEVTELGLEGEESLCASHQIQFRSFPIPDQGTPPSYNAVHTICEQINSVRTADQKVAVHCRAGIGRSSIVAACSLVICGRTARDAFGLISQARGLIVPDTDEQIHWVEQFALSRLSS